MSKFFFFLKKKKLWRYPRNYIISLFCHLFLNNSFNIIICLTIIWTSISNKKSNVYPYFWSISKSHFKYHITIFKSLFQYYYSKINKPNTPYFLFNRVLLNFTVIKLSICNCKMKDNFMLEKKFCPFLKVPNIIKARDVQSLRNLIHTIRSNSIHTWADWIHFQL